MTFEMDPVTLDDALEKKCGNRRWLLCMFLLTATPGLLNAAHIASYTFLGGDPSFFCDIPELVEANWTREQIREISTPGLEKQTCFYYGWNYTLLKDLGYEEALSYYNVTQKPDLIKCRGYIYDEETHDHQTIISEWDLVCEDSHLRTLAQGSVAFGKFFGASVFGLLSDRYGRRKAFIIAAPLYMTVATSTALVNNYMIFIVLRMLIGFASAGTIGSAFTIMMEMTVNKYRVYFGNLINISYSFGLIILPTAAYYTNNWRQLQLAISLPVFGLLIHCWLLPDSPRWLMIKGKLEKASNIIGKNCQLAKNELLQPTSSNLKSQLEKCSKQVLFFIKDFTKLFSTLELTKRILISYYLYFFGFLYFFILAMNGSNFGVEPHLYMGLNGILDIPGYLFPIILLTYFGRKSCGIVLYIMIGVSMLVITVLPQGWPIVCVTLLGRFLGATAGGVAAFLIVEMFPTENRNAAVGTSVAISQFGPILAPYIVETGGKIFWWIPTVLCGFLAFLGAFLLMFVPETRGVPMMDTISEMKRRQKEIM